MRRSSVRIRPPALLRLESRAMRSHHPRRSWRPWALAVATMAFLLVPHVALAQQSIDPTATPEKSTGGWIYWMAEASIGMGALVLLLSGAAILRFAPRVFRTDREGEAN